MIDKSTFCTRPWNELHIEEDGRITPCCVMPTIICETPPPTGINNYLKSDWLASLKNNLKSGIKDKSCRTCWMQEDLGYKSHRKTTVAEGKKLNKVEAVHLRTSNVCNFKCRICAPDLSSSWQAENKKHRFFKDDYVIFDNILDDEQYCHELIQICKQVKQIWISGGEPLISKTTLKFIEKCHEYGITNTNIAFNTNLSSLHYKNHYWLDEFKGLKVTLTVSMDGFGKQMEYHRTGLVWKTLLKNVQDALPWIYNINCVLSIYSVYTIPELINFCHVAEKELEINPVMGRHNIQSVFNLPDVEKQKIVNHYHKYFEDKPQHLFEQAEKAVLIPLLSNKGDLKTNQAFKQYNTMLDYYRKTNFLETYPEYREWYQSI
jgi:molybdenum cofactor biosynthesis enzyme MoaA